MNYEPITIQATRDGQRVTRNACLAVAAYSAEAAAKAEESGIEHRDYAKQTQFCLPQADSK